MLSGLSPEIVAVAPLLCAAAHICEEFVLPGGFIPWYKSYRPDLADSITVSHLIVINTILVSACLYIAATGMEVRHGASAWLIVSAILGANAYFYINGSIATMTYSPGMVTGCFLYIPLLFVGVSYVILTNLLPPTAIAFSTTLGFSYQYWSNLLHKIRAQR